MARIRTACLLFVSLATCLGCGGPKASDAPEPEPTPAEAPPAPAEATAAPAGPSVPESGDAAGGEAKAPAAPPTAPAPAEERDPNAPREVRYIQTPEGLKVEVSGVRFLVTAKSTKVGGGFGVRVSLAAESIDQKQHSLLVTERGPLAMAGSVERKGKRTSFGDERKGDTEQTIAPGKSGEFFRDWPPKGETPLANGESVELDLGLWGVGDDTATRRPLKQLARVKARVEAWKGKATVEPPPNVGK